MKPIPHMYRFLCCLAAAGLMSQSVLLGQLTLMIGADLGGGIESGNSSVPDLQIDEFVSASYAYVATEAIQSTGAALRIRPTWSPNSFVKLDMDISYHFGFSQIGTWLLSGDTLTASQVNSARVVLSPGLTICLGERRFSPYVRIGWLIPQSYSIAYETMESRNVGMVGQDLEVEVRTFHGIHASLGAQYRLSRHVRIYYELSYQHQIAWIESIELERYEVNGADELDQLATYQVKARFQEVWGDELNQPDRQGFDPDKPLEVESRAQDMSSFRLSFGLVFVIAR